MKIKIEPTEFVYPMPVVLVGTRVAGRANFLTVGWMSQVNWKPPMISVALGKNHFTNPGIRETRAFSVNVPGIDLMVPTDYCGMVSGKDSDKARLFTVVFGEMTGSPLIEECRLSMECRLTRTVDLEGDELFIGEVLAVYADAEALRDGKVDVRRIDPLIFSKTDNGYWRLGERIGSAWCEGKKLRPS